MKTFVHRIFQSRSLFKAIRACGMLCAASILLESSVSFAETITVTADGQPITPSGYTQPFTGENSLVKTGTGTFTINTAATYTGSTTINEGTLKVSVNNGLTRTSGITVASGATFQLATGNATGLGNSTPAVTLNGGALTTTFNGHVNVGNLTMNGGSLSSGTYTPSAYGNFLMAGSVTVTENATINANKILIRNASNGYAETTGKFIVSPGKTLTLNTQINFKDTNYDSTDTTQARYSHWQISGGGTVLMMQGSTSNNNTKITVSGATLDVCAGNAFGTTVEAQHTMTLNKDGILNISTPNHINTGKIILNGGKITSIDSNGNKLGGSAYGNILVAGKITVTDDSSIDCSKIYIRGTMYFNDTDIGQGHFEVAEGKTLTLNAAINFSGNGDAANEGGNVFIEGKGTVIVPTLGSNVNVDISRNKLSVSEATLQYGDGGSTGSWSMPMTLTKGATFATNRSSMLFNYGFTIDASNATISNIGTCGITFGSLITVTDDTASPVDLTFTGTNTITINGGMLTGAGTVQKTGSNIVLLAAANNGYSGETIISEGIIQAKSDVAFGSGKIVLDGGRISNARTDGAWLQLGNAVEVKSNSSIYTGATSTVLKGNLTGSATLTKETSGSQLHFSGDNSAFSGKIISKSNWLSFKFNPNDGNKTNSSSALADYVIDNGTETSGFVFVPKANTDVFKFGMIETSNKNAMLRAGADATNAGLTAVNIQVGGTDKSGTFAGQIADYTSNSVTAVVNIEKVGTGTWIWANSNTGLTYGALSTGTLTISNGVFQLGNGGTEAVGHLQGFNYLDTDPMPTSAMPIIVQENGTLAFNRTDAGNLRLNQSVTFNGGTLLQMGSKAVVFNAEVLGSEMVIDAAEGGTGTIFFQKSDVVAATVDVAKVTINGGNVTAKGDFNANTVTSVNGGTFFIGTGSRANTFTSKIQLNDGGTLVSGNSSSLIGDLVMNGGQLGDSNKSLAEIKVTKAEFNGGTIGGKQRVYITDLNMKSGSTLVDQQNTDGRVYVTNLTGSGKLTLNGNGQNSQQLHFTGDATAFTGTIVSDNNGFVGLFGSKSVSPNAKYQSLRNGNFVVSSIATDAGTYQFGELSGAGGIFRPSTSNAQAIVNVEVGGANTNSTYGGSFQDQTNGIIAVTKVGTGTWTLSGTSTSKGGTTVKEGELCLMGIVASDVTVKSGASFSGTGSITGRLLMDLNTQFVVDLTDDDIYRQLIEEHNPLEISGEISAEDALTIKIIADDEIIADWDEIESFEVLKALNSLNFDLDLSDAAGFWSGSFENGILRLMGTNNANAIPEPSTWLLLLAGVGFLGLLRRKGLRLGR